MSPERLTSHPISPEFPQELVEPDSILRCGPYALVRETGEFMYERSCEPLTPTEVNVLSPLLEFPNTPKTRKQLSVILYGDENRTNAISAQIFSIRNKIEVDPKKPKIIETVPKRGYIIRIDESDMDSISEGPVDPERFVIAGGLKLDILTGIFEDGERRIPLHHREAELVAHLMRSPNTPFSTSILLQKLFGDPSFGVEANISQQVFQIRKKIERDPNNPQIILHLSRMGYYISVPELVQNPNDDGSFHFDPDTGLTRVGDKQVEIGDAKSIRFFSNIFSQPGTLISVRRLTVFVYGYDVEKTRGNIYDLTRRINTRLAKGGEAFGRIERVDTPNGLAYVYVAGKKE